MPISESEKGVVRSTFGDYAPEIIMSIVLLGSTVFMEMAGKINEQTTWIIGTLTATIGVTIVILKMHFSEVAALLAARCRHIDSKVGHMGAIMETLSGKDFDHANLIVDEMLQKLQKIPQGEIPLDEAAYFGELFDALRTAPKGCQVLAVNSIDIARWAEDPRQKNWLRANAEAIRRGIAIHRIFLIERNDFQGPQLSMIRDTLGEHVDIGVQVSVVRKGDVHLSHDLHDDFVIFQDGHSKLFVDEVDPHDPPRVLRGALVTNSDRITKHRKAFDILLASALDPEFLTRLLGRA